MPDITGDIKALEAVADYSTLGTEEAKVNKDTFLQYRSSRQAWYSDKVENDRFFHNVHYTDSEATEIAAKGQAPLSINVTYAIIKQIISFLTSSSPTWWVSPTGDSAKSTAYLMRKLLDATWYNSMGRRRLTQIVKETAITGLGWGMVNPKADSPFGVEFKNVPYHNVYVDPYSSELDFSDADAIVISKLLSHRQAALFLRKTVDEIKEMASSDITLTDQSDDPKSSPYPRYVLPSSGASPRVRIIQRHQMEEKECYVVKPTKPGVPITRKVYFNLTDDIKKLEGAGLIKVEKVKRRVLAKYISLGEYCERYYLPIEGYNIAPFIDEFNGNPYPMGEVDFLYGLQRALNKFILLAILNATLSNNMKMIGPKNSINRAQYENEYAIPGVFLEYEIEEGQEAPKQMNPMPLPNEFFAFPQMIISMMEYITGIFGVLQGNPEGAPRTASGLLSLQNYGGQKVKLIGRNMEDALITLGDSAISLFQNYAGFNQTLSYYDEQLNKDEQVAYNTLAVRDGGNIEIENDLSVGKFKTRVSIRQDYGGERQAKAQVLANLAAQTKSPSLIKPILKLADIPEADEIIKEIDMIAQTTQKAEQLEGTLKKMEQINTHLENQVMEKSKQVEIERFKTSLNKMLSGIDKSLSTRVEGAFADLEKQLLKKQVTSQPA